MKKTLAIMMSGLLLAGCGQSASSAVQNASSATEESGIFTPGSYTASAPGRNGDVTVTTVFSANTIDEIKIESEETENIGVVAMEQLKEEVLSSQALDADVISGATLSSDAFLNALKDTVTQAGGDPESLTGAPKEEVAAEYETEADVIIVGAGAAGMTAAITAKTVRMSLFWKNPMFSAVIQFVLQMVLMVRILRFSWRMRHMWKKKLQ